MKPKTNTMVDANVILRYLLNDVPEQALCAEKILCEQNVFVTIEVIAEVVYVLKGVYSVERSEIARILTNFLSLVNCQEKDILIFSLQTYERQNLDFVDCVLYAYHAIKGFEIKTFDKVLLKFLGMG